MRDVDESTPSDVTATPAVGGQFSALREDVVWDDPAHLRGEILTEAQLFEHARQLGKCHLSSTTRGLALPLRRRFKATRNQVRSAYATLSLGVERKREPSPAEIWLLDNGHVVEGQLREIDEDLPWGYLVKLPRIGQGKMRGYPLVYALCVDYLRYTDCRVDIRSLQQFIEAYQGERVLTTGELWAVPIMLRLGLVLAVSVLAASEAQASDRDVADEWARRLLGAAASSPGESGGGESVAALLTELERERGKQPPSDAFLVTLLRRLREREDAPTEVLDWIARCTEALHTTPEELARGYHLRQAADQVSVGNAITSMRAINTLDWSVFFRSSSRVEAILLRDPGDVYAQMDDPSRDRCRHAVERLARRSGASEVEVAALALSLAVSQRDHEQDYRAHIGYYLLDAGRAELYRALRYTPRIDIRVKEWASTHPTVLYLGGIAVLTLGCTLLAWAALSVATSSTLIRFMLLPVMLLAASEIAVAMVNAVVVTLIPPRILPKFEFEAGIPAQYSTLVVVPTLLDGPSGIARLLEELEVRRLANTDENLYFGLLTDFRDADSAEMPDDAQLLQLVQAGIERLNEGQDEPKFFLFHRRRIFEPSAACFMGWERKRGKIAEFNRLLRGAADTTFTVVTAPAQLLARIKYVITLDTDTELPLGVARRLVAAIAHPLNRPWLDQRRQRVQRGHAIIQPRVGTSPMSARQSAFARLAAGPPGIDPYTTAVSDVYQDLFGQGSFVGKGIYDVDAFEAATRGRFPTNQLLSHDLIESIYARAALASDIEVLDEQPAAYSVAAGRNHRWTRGDWQLLPWLWPWVPAQAGTRRFDFSWFDAWRVVDNLRRSLLAPALVLLASVTWLSGWRTALVGSLLLLAVFIVPVVGRLVFAFARADSQLDWLGGLGGDLKSNAQQAFLSLTFLLDQALVSADAIVRANYRQFVSRRGMLEWTSMRDAARRSDNSVLRVPRLLAASTLALGTLGAVGWSAPRALLLSGPVLLLWVLSPWVAVRVSRVQPKGAAQPWGEEELHAFRRVARKTWRFFERFVGDIDHHLPPDNFQEDPRGVVAHRTSPTNIGLYLLSVASARDLGFIPLKEAMQRWGKTLTTIERLEKREGHVLNWYDTKTLAPLEPRYISTVDSGNLAGYLWTLSECCRDMSASPCVSGHVFSATRDALMLAREALGGDPGQGREAADGRAVRRSRAAPSPTSRALARVSALLQLVEEAETALQADPAQLVALVLSTERKAEALLLGEASDGSPEGDYWLGVGLRTLSLARATIHEHLPHWAWLHEQGLSAQAHGQALERQVLETANPDALVAHFEQLIALGRSTLGDVEAQAEFERQLGQAREQAQLVQAELSLLARRAEQLVDQMDFTFLYDEDRSLFSIGYNVSSARLDTSHYDLLASEARLASLVSVAKGDVPVKHWFRLGRLRAKYASTPGLLSWSGSMFEYLMPLLVMRSYPDTLLDQTCLAVVERQIEYAKSFGVPWGISEAAYNVMDLNMNYQYRAFGVPGLGLKPGLGEDLVVAPYATALAALVTTSAAAQNLARLRAAGLEGLYGFYEAVDYTPARLPPSRKFVVVKAFMAHHQGMILVALSNLLSDFAMQRRFHADPRVKACALLLEERIPVRAGVVQPETPRAASTLSSALDQEETDHLDLAQVRGGPLRGHLLGQGSLSTWVTSGGEGFLTWRGLDVQRFREEASLECGGIYLYFQNLDQAHYWSSGYMPTRAEPSHYDVVFSIDKVEIGRRDGDIETLTEITLSPEHPAEIRRITLTNHAKKALRISVTSFTELALTARSSDVAHPAFQKMFVETEFLQERGALIAHRRKRSAHDPNVWMAQVFVGVDPAGPVLAGTSRAAFLGRGGSAVAPVGLSQLNWAQATSGALDPALILRRDVEVQGGGQVRLSLVTMLAETREALVEQIEQFADAHSVPRAFEFAWADARVELRHLGITSTRAHRYQRLLSAVLFPHHALRGSAHPPAGARGRDALWSQGISGDLPIVVLRLDDPEFAELCRELLLAHEYWRLNGVATDLVILNEEEPSYFQPVQDAIFSLIRSTPAEGHVDQRGGVFVRRTALVAEEDLQLMVSAARVVLHVSKGSLSQQLRAVVAPSLRRGRAAAPRPLRPAVPLLRLPRPRGLDQPQPAPQQRLAYFNGLGGFVPETGEYLMQISRSQKPPQPWCNVMAGPHFGTVISESGASFTWFENSQRYRLTPWFNDPTIDPAGELFFARDMDTGEHWSLTPGPDPGEAVYAVRHGQGCSSFSHERSGLSQTVRVGVDPDDPVKIWHISLHNRASRRRSLRVYAYAEWVLGNHRETLRASTITTYRPESRACLARNPFSPFPTARSFLVSTAQVRSFTADRDEFFGRFASRGLPCALFGSGLSGHFGHGFDPCSAMEVEITLEAGQHISLAFVLGAAAEEKQALELIARYGELAETETSLSRATERWNDLLGRVQVRTPDPAFDLLTNRWLPYQVLSCRFWGRSAFFQSGGAYGYRDQLQDSMALLHMCPDLARQHILRAASRQFLEGDVQHWWHPDSGEGVRTHCSDDLLWLPWAALEYVSATRDDAIWDEPVGFLQERLLEPGRDDLYSVPPAAAESAPLYEHCVRALRAARTQGKNGLPLMRAGDWNDGMNRLGEQGQGESVWLAWFLAHVAERFGKVAQARGDHEWAAWCSDEFTRLGAAVDRTAWDGGWYQRGTFDDGTPVGSHQAEECRIDAIAQSWAVIARAGRAERASQALDASLQHLWNRPERMMQLLTPPFSGKGPDPGYIAAYPPGIRENGGQYSHGVLWTALALLLERRGAEGYELLADLNPIRHSTQPADLAKYQVEPYVLAADVYSVEPHVGRGGWTWYTGSASWMYRIGIEWLLGVQRRGNELVIDPCVPPDWPHFEIEYRAAAGGRVSIVVDNPEAVSSGVKQLWLDGRILPGVSFPLPALGQTAQVRVVLGAAVANSSSTKRAVSG